MACVIAFEPFVKAWPEMNILAAIHFKEVEGPLALRRPYNPDPVTAQRMEELGLFKIVTARVDGELAGYFTWSLSHDVESKDLLIANQGAWFVLPGYNGVALQMFKFSKRELSKFGVEIMLLHHRMRGRGKMLGKFFSRQGAIEIKHEYYLDLREVRNG